MKCACHYYEWAVTELFYGIVTYSFFSWNTQLATSYRGQKVIKKISFYISASTYALIFIFYITEVKCSILGVCSHSATEE